MPYREDCWSEDETSSHVDAWGDRYIELNRRNLRQKPWQEVADAINSHRGTSRRLSCTDVQCKNRIDTLKKKYKVEKSRVAGSGESQFLLARHLRVRPAKSKKKRTAVASSAVDIPFFRCAAVAAATEGKNDIDEAEVVAALEEKKSAMVEKEAEEDASNCDLDGSNSNISASEAATIINSSLATTPAVPSDMEVSKMEFDANAILQHCKDTFESDNGISATGNVDVVEEAVLKSKVDSFPVSEWQQGKVDSIKEVSIPPHLMVGDFKGIKVQEAKPMIRNKLLESGDAVMYREPEKKIMSRSDELTLSWLNPWACSPSFGFGTCLPWDEQFLVESLSYSTLSMAFYTVAHLLQCGDMYGLDHSSVKPEQMTDDVWDYIFGGGPQPKSDVPMVLLNKMKQEFDYWTLRQAIKEFSSNATRFSLSDAGDGRSLNKALKTGFYDLQATRDE
ncbi:hypothetical protein ZIOFF_041498 [Zingiber officinale]|uniref:Myb/SANT-like DNA-binding domain-containing protein n=1 Tax=Zingiber officinale TaxID=94328 RepID=A0A8J5G6Q5_ZINOF|nr:hypothetical protein ZIOFF_041498 [Zingiber officinale]